MRNRARIATLVASSLVLAAAGAGAQTIGAPTNGQSYGCTNPANANPFWCGQSFVAPVGANVLQSFSFTLDTPSSLTFELYAFASPNVLGSALFTQALGPTAGGDETFVFAPAGGVAVTGGASYVALVRIETGEEVWFQANDTDVYADGSAQPCTGGSGSPASCFPFGDYDLAFDATFGVAPTVTPEPATLALTGGGLLLLGGLAHRRRRTPN